MDERARCGRIAAKCEAALKCFVILLTCAAVSVVHAVGAPAVDADPLTVMEKVIEAGASLSDFSARVNLLVCSGRLAGFELSGQAFVRRPGEVAFKIMWATVRPENSMLFPDPARFLDKDLYRLSMAEVNTNGESLEYVVQAEPLYPYRDVLYWLFAIDDAQWLIRRAEVVLRDGSTSSLSAEYTYIGSENYFLPSKMTGIGGAFIEEVFSVGWLSSLAVWLAGSDVEYVVTLSDHRVNTGLPDSPLN